MLRVGGGSDTVGNEKRINCGALGPSSEEFLLPVRLWKGQKLGWAYWVEGREKDDQMLPLGRGLWMTPLFDFHQKQV
ncbi:hypothetical protein TNCT_360431 [Trichonephila clavata]|uniref:Uncharacterized protein n=1 Tax=Trichonephila clavata TaxID=2740835 RepID=A0A8X6G8N2_TRICU|nr:hypothetical protein TNCT_360431 [Trichonephila clavata]